MGLDPVSSKVFSTFDKEIFFALKGWGLKRHARKGKQWVINKYYTTYKNDHWRFHCPIKDKKGQKTLLFLRKAGETHIRRHKKIKAQATRFNPLFEDYFKQRERERKACLYDRKTADSTGLRYIQPC